jgi:pimeloyl-ACP methyl ester carboxylesterase
MGANIGIRLAELEPQRIIRLMIVDYGVGLNDEAIDAMRAMFSDQFRQYRSVEEYVEYLLEWRPLASPPILRAYASQALRNGTHHGYELKCDPRLVDAGHPDRDQDILRTTFERLETPVMLVRGAGSGILSMQAATQTSRHFRFGSLKVVAKAGHGVMTDNPVGFASAAKEFLLPGNGRQ